ncbi:helix-turn-helix domain-containing protein [Xanthomonas prunicola]|uniref:Helix-turn-helix transcriptional regulator n=1 Tax=Xanthomonas prunicola TaxID=2053930 RepID=A0A9Q9J4T1_9XANT|nr:helix-turn-helix transcriptional regulator [Xanthomonas prunicola]UXA66046.1 helix-turn-helix transcriptional regulator [Xanthomonas prunicola]
MKRLYEAASKLQPPIRGQSDLARRLSQSPQTVKNWEARPTGVSAAGASKAQHALGISTTWILEGSLPMFVGDETRTHQSQDAGSIREILAAAVTIARRVQDMAIAPIEGERYVQLLTEAAMKVQESGAGFPLEGASLDDAAREVAARLRSNG